MATDDDTEVRFSLRLHDSTAKTAVPVKRSEQRPHGLVREADNARLCGPSLPAGPGAPRHWFGADQS